MSAGKLVILSGPSGVGKDTVIDSWKSADPRVTRVVAYTTRPPRPGEVDGVDYNFVTKERFEEKNSHGDFLEFKVVYENMYATPLADMEAMLRDGKIAVLKIDVQGALTVMELRPDALTIFLLPPDEQELIRRIRDRGTEEGAVLDKRIENAQFEIARSDKYQYRVVNDRVDLAVARLKEIVGI